MDELRAKLDRSRQFRHHPRVDAPADTRARLEHEHRQTVAGQLGRGAQTGGAGPDDGNIKVG
jgi:hypothetical protein